MAAPGDSDIDLFFDDKRGNFGPYGLMAVKEAATRILRRKGAGFLMPQRSVILLTHDMIAESERVRYALGVRTLEIFEADRQRNRRAQRGIATPRL